MTLHCPRALIVEDECLIAFSLEADMQELGYEACDIAPNATEAMALAMENKPDIAVMDVYLNGAREGIEVARWLREVCDVPVVFVTAYGDQGVVERIHQQVPGAPVLSKPLYGQKLADAIGKVQATH
jgi:two-component system, response regulator PdtaR